MIAIRYTGPESRVNRLAVLLLATGAGGLRAPGVALCHQVTTLDRAKLSERLGMLPPGALTELQAGLRTALDLD